MELEQTRRLKPWQLAREEMLSTRLDGLSLGRTRISTEGSVAGRGLFAARDIREGELITCYPGDALVLLNDDAGERIDIFKYGVCTHNVIFGQHVPTELADAQACFGPLGFEFVVVCLGRDSDTGTNACRDYTTLLKQKQTHS